MLRLIWSNFSTRRVRLALTAAAIALSVSLVVAVTSGYATGESAALAYLNRYLGGADAQITRPQSIADGPVPQRLMVELSGDPDVHRVTARLEIYSNLFDKEDKPVEKATFHVIGIERPQDSRIDSLIVESGSWFDHSDGNFAVVDQIAAEALKVSVGDSFFMASDQGRLRLTVVGIIHKPEILATAVKTIYVPLHTLQHFQGVDGRDSQISRIAIDFRRGVDPDAFAQRWNDRLDQLNQQQAQTANHSLEPLKLRIVSQDRGAMDANLQSIHILSYIGGAVSMLAATFIIFSSLAMGVSERQRTLAMLRAIGATRGQLAGMVVIEGLLITALGVLIGAPLGLLWTECLRQLFQDFLASTGLTVSWNGILLAVGGALAAALAASLLPAWAAARLDPLEAMAPLAEVPPQGPPLRWARVGLLLICIDPLIFFVPWEKLVARINPAVNAESLTTLMRFYAHYTIGSEGVFIGFFLLAPLMVWCMERALAPLIGRLLGLPTALLRQQLSTGLWRAAGAAAALMVGLAVLVIMTTQGTSMLDGWKLPDKFPDIFLVSLKFGGLDSAQWTNLGQTTGIRRFPGGEPELMPIAVTMSGLGSNPLALMGAVLAPSVSGTMFFGIPPKEAFQMMELDFRDDFGQHVPPDQQAIFAQHAREQLETGRHVIVTEDYRRLHHVRYGDKITLFSETQKYEYTICGIVWSPGLDVIVAMFDMGRQFEQRTAGMVFGSLDDARRDFGADHVNLFAANLDMGVDKDQVLADVRKRMGEINIKAGDVRQIKAEIDHGFRRLMLLLTTVAFGAMGVASMGVTNTIMASIRSRRWQFGVLRSIGLCAGDLLKLVLAEALLLGLVGLILGLGCGATLAADVRRLGADMLGYLPPLVIPWGYIIIGAAAVMVVSVGAALWPALTISRTDPLSLLQAGRAST
jgi:putative ABC transport system permease protein